MPEALNVNHNTHTHARTCFVKDNTNTYIKRSRWIDSREIVTMCEMNFFLMRCVRRLVIIIVATLFSQVVSKKYLNIMCSP